MHFVELTTPLTHALALDYFLSSHFPLNLSHIDTSLYVIQPRQDQRPVRPLTRSLRRTIVMIDDLRSVTMRLYCVRTTVIFYVRLRTLHYWLRRLVYNLVQSKMCQDLDYISLLWNILTGQPATSRCLQQAVDDFIQNIYTDAIFVVIFAALTFDMVPQILRRTHRKDEDCTTV